jgi:hypothetical protein
VFIKTFSVDRNAVSERLFDLGNGKWDIPELRHLVEAVIPKAAAVVAYEVRHDFSAIGLRTSLVDVRHLVHPDERSVNLLIVFDVVTNKQRHDTERDHCRNTAPHEKPVCRRSRHRRADESLEAFGKAIAIPSSGSMELWLRIGVRKAR